MNPLTLVKRIQKINQRETSLGISDEASWHTKYKDSAYIFVGSIPFDLTEGDLLAVFAQYGEIVDINLLRDKATGKSKGFAFVAYEDQRSTNLARAANTGWGDEEDRRSKWAHDKFEGSRRMGRQSSQSAHMLESPAGEGHRMTDKKSEVSEGKYESMTRDGHNKLETRDTNTRLYKGKGMNYEGNRDISSLDRRSAR